MEGYPLIFCGLIFLLDRPFPVVRHELYVRVQTVSLTYRLWEVGSQHG